MIRTIPKGSAMMVMHKMTPTIIRMTPSPAVISLPSKVKTRPTKNQTSLNGNMINSNNNESIETLLNFDGLLYLVVYHKEIKVG